MLHLNTSETETPDWARIGKSTVLDLVMNAVTEENDFIEDEMATTDVMSYKPAISEELQTNKGDKAFDHIYAMFKSRPTGEAIKKDVLLTFAGNIGSEDAPKFDAWRCEASLTLDHFDAVAEKIYFNLTINSVVDGTVTVTGGVPTFASK